MKYKRVELIETESRTVVPRADGGENGKSLGKGYTLSDRRWINSRKLICAAVIIVNSPVSTWNLLRESIFNALIALGEEKKKKLLDDRCVN